MATTRYRERDRATRSKRQRAQRAEVAAFKQREGCNDCGYNERSEALDFDHVVGTKLFSIGTQMGRKMETIMNEINKCDVVCANCHRIRTVARLRVEA